MDTLRRLFVRDFGLKLFSLAVAVLIWVTVNYAIQEDLHVQGRPMARVRERTFRSLPVLVVSAAADVRAFRVSPSTVDVIVLGDPAVLSRLQERDIHPFVDLTNIEAAQDLRKRVEISAPAGVMHSKVLPESVDVVIPPKL